MFETKFLKIQINHKDKQILINKAKIKGFSRISKIYSNSPLTNIKVSEELLLKQIRGLKMKEDYPVWLKMLLKKMKENGFKLQDRK